MNSSEKDEPSITIKVEKDDYYEDITAYRDILGKCELMKDEDETEGCEQSLHSETYKCEHCEERFELHALKNHLRIHAKLDGQKSDNECDLKGNSSKTAFQCEHCGMMFNSNVSLNVHNQEKHDNTNCEKKSIQIYTLEEHLKLYPEGQEPYKCEHCGKKFSQRSHWTSHRRIHTGETPYVCEHCGKKFNTIGILKKHLRTHTREQSYECEHCDKKFIHKSHWKYHLRMHSGETYECELCEKKYNHPTALRRHRKKHKMDIM